MEPDVLALNEFVDGPGRQALRQDLHALGLVHVAVSERLNGHNQVLVASRLPFVLGELSGPESPDRGGESNFLHVSFTVLDLDFVGLRAPAYESRPLAAYWLLLRETVRANIDKPIVFMGDLNTDPQQSRRASAKHLQSMIADGWTVPVPEGPWSFVSRSGQTTRIDHAIVSPLLQVVAARYVCQSGDLLLAGPSRKSAISDHAPLVLDIRVPPGKPTTA